MFHLFFPQPLPPSALELSPHLQHPALPTGGTVTLHHKGVFRQGVAFFFKLFLAVRIILVCSVGHFPPAFDYTPTHNGGQGGYWVVLTVGIVLPCITFSKSTTFFVNETSS